MKKAEHNDKQRGKSNKGKEKRKKLTFLLVFILSSLARKKGVYGDFLHKALKIASTTSGADPGFQKGGWMADHIY